jgi:hypothetical protein
VKVRVNPRSIGAEGPYITTDVRKLARLKAELVDNGVPAYQALALVGWLVDKAAGAPDTTTATTRAAYRKLLAELDSAGPDQPGRARGDQGVTRIRPAACAALTATATMAVAQGHPAIALALTPIILERPPEKLAA